MGERMHGDRGLTLVELLVTISLLTVVMTALTGSVIVLQRVVNETDQRLDDLAQARLAMDASTKWVRSAVTVAPFSSPFLEARADRVDLLANIDVAGGGAPKRVVLQVVNGDELQEQVWDGAFDSDDEWQQSGTPRTRVIARGVTNATALFTFVAEDGTDLTDGTTNLSAADREAIRRVGIDVTVRQDPVLDVGASELRNVVWLPNQFYFDDEVSS